MVIVQLDQQPLLIQAIFTGDVEEVQSALEFKQDVNYQDCEKRSPLHAASFKGDAEVAALLLSHGARVNTKDNKWITPLHRACCCGSSDLVSLLLRHQADVTARDRQWQTPLHVAAANNAVECVAQLLECVPTCNVTDRMGRTALHHAAVNGHNDVVELLLSKGCIANACDKKDCRPIHCASHMGHVDTIELLLRNGADINAKDRNQYSPLHVAAASGMVSACRVLLQSGAEVDARNAYGNTPLHIACLNGHLPVCNVLASFGADLEAVNYRGQTPLHIAAASTHGVDCLNFLVDQKVNINKQSLDGRSPLHMTAIHGRFTRSKTLIDKGAIVDCTDKNGCTALHIAAQYGHDLLSNTLLTYGADPSKKGYSGRTPLHMSCLSGYVECCRKFLQAGVDLNALDDSGKTLIHCAAYKGSVECLDLLVSNGADFQLLDNIGRTPLHYAAVQGHYPCVFTLVGLGSNVNLSDAEGCSPLHLAAAYDIKGECVEYLLRHKADPKLKDKKGFTPIHYAVAGGNFAGLGFLLSVVGNSYIMYGPDMPLTTPLHLAARNGNQDLLQLLLSYFHDTNIRTEHGSTALLLAAKAGNTHCVQMLLRYGAKVAITDTIQHMSPVHFSARNGHMHCLALLLDNTEDKNVIDLPDSLQRTPLMLAVAGGHAESALTLLKCGADANVVDGDKHSSLFRAVVNGHHNTVQLLLSHGAEVDKSDVNGKTVLHLAAACGHLSCLQTLINTMDLSTMTALDNQDCTALHWACYNGNPNCVSYLLERDIFKEFKGNVFSPIHCATFVGAERCIELLCNYYGTDIVKLKDARNRTPLHIASLHGHVDCAKYLLEKGAEIDCKDADDRTPLIAAAQNGQSQIIDILLSYKADVTSYDNNGNTALHLACLKRHSHSALLLLENIDDVEVVNMINNDRKTPLHLSARNGLVNVTRQLISKGSSVLAVDANGMTPALCCAPNSSVAQCLALILANYAICSQQNNSKERSTSTSYLIPKKVASTSATDLKQAFEKHGKRIKTYRTQTLQTDLSLLRDPDYFECQKMFKRHYNSPHRSKTKHHAEVAGGKPKIDFSWKSVEYILCQNNHDKMQELLKSGLQSVPGAEGCFIVENYKSEERWSKPVVQEKVGHSLHRSYSDILIAHEENHISKETLKKIMLGATTKKNPDARFRYCKPQHSGEKGKSQTRSLSVNDSADKQRWINFGSKNFHKTVKEISQKIISCNPNVNLEPKRQVIKTAPRAEQKEEMPNTSQQTAASVSQSVEVTEEAKVSSVGTTIQPGQTAVATTVDNKNFSNATKERLDELKQVFEETMHKISEQESFLQSKSGLDGSKSVATPGLVKCEEIISENSIRENRMQKLRKVAVKHTPNKNSKAAIRLQQKKGMVNMQSVDSKAKAFDLTIIGKKMKVSEYELEAEIDVSEKAKTDDTLNKTELGPGEAGVKVVEEIYINSKKLLEANNLTANMATMPKLKIIETGNDDEIINIDQVMQQEQVVVELEVEKLRNYQKNCLDGKEGSVLQEIVVDEKSPANIIIKGLEMMRSTTNLNCIAQHMHMLNTALTKLPKSIPHAVEIMKHIMATLKEHEWLEKLKHDLPYTEKLAENVGVELFALGCSEDIHRITEELLMKITNYESFNELESESDSDKNVGISREDIKKNGVSMNEGIPEDVEKKCVTEARKGSQYDDGKGKDSGRSNNSSFAQEDTSKGAIKKNSFRGSTCSANVLESHVGIAIDRDESVDTFNTLDVKRKNVDETTNTVKNDHNRVQFEISKKDERFGNTGDNIIIQREMSNIKTNDIQDVPEEKVQEENDMCPESEKQVGEYFIHSRKEGCKGDSAHVRCLELTAFHLEPQAIISSCSLTSTSVQTRTGSGCTLTQENVGIYDSNCDLYKLHKNDVSNDEEAPNEEKKAIQKDQNKQEGRNVAEESSDEKNAGEEEKGNRQEERNEESMLQNEEPEEKGEIEAKIEEDMDKPKICISGTISMVPYLSVQKEMELTLESVETIGNVDAILEKSSDKASKPSLKTLYVRGENPDRDEDNHKGETVNEDESTEVDPKRQHHEKKSLSDNREDLGEDEKLTSTIEEEKSLQKDGVSEEKLALYESSSNDELHDEKHLKAGKKNSVSNIAKKKLLRSRESSQCCVS